MADSLGRGNDPESFEGLLCPFQERIALTVAVVFHGDVHGKGGRGPEVVDLDRVVDDEVRRHHRVDPGRIAAHPFGGRAHGRQVHHGRNPGEVLEQDPGRHEGDFLGLLTRPPAGKAKNVLL